MSAARKFALGERVRVAPIARSFTVIRRAFIAVVVGFDAARREYLVNPIDQPGAGPFRFGPRELSRLQAASVPSFAGEDHGAHQPHDE